jgi:hypothetical protein
MNDFINGRNFFLKGDGNLLTDNFFQNFQFNPLLTLCTEVNKTGWSRKPLHKCWKLLTAATIVFDGSYAKWKVNKWRPEAAKLGRYCFYSVDNGAFVMNTD